MVIGKCLTCLLSKPTSFLIFSPPVPLRKGSEWAAVWEFGPLLVNLPQQVKFLHDTDVLIPH